LVCLTMNRVRLVNGSYRAEELVCLTRNRVRLVNGSYRAE